MKAKISHIEIPDDATEEDIVEAIAKDMRANGIESPPIEALQHIAREVAGNRDNVPEGRMIHNGTGTMQ